MKKALLLVVASVVITSYGPLRADERLTPLAASGDWIALQHAESMISRPDVCMAASVTSTIAFRADERTTELRVNDETWSLPVGVRGTVKVDVGAFHQDFAIADNTDTMVTVLLTYDDVLRLFEAMDKASSMTVTAGNSKPRLVSLAGSTKATNAFRTCARINSSGEGGGANPFAK